MGKFITRVELHGASWPSDYEDLHRYMAEENFGRVIQGDDGEWYHLPMATYFSHGTRSPHEMFALARRAAARTFHDAEICVIEANTIVWKLKPVRNGLAALALGIPPNPLGALSRGMTPNPRAASPRNALTALTLGMMPNPFATPLGVQEIPSSSSAAVLGAINGLR